MKYPIAVLAFALAFFGSHARAEQMPCAPSDNVATALATFNEAPMAQGVTPNGFLMRLWVSPEGATWTITYTFPDGTTCMMGAGESLDLLQWKRPEPKRGT